jgi:hypothetical protein
MRKEDGSAFVRENRTIGIVFDPGAVCGLEKIVHRMLESGASLLPWTVV